MTLLDGLDLSPSGGTMVAPIYPHHRRPDDTFMDYDDYKALQKALEAALAVIDAFDGYGQSLDLDSELQRMETARSMLESTLLPFRKGGL